MEHFDVIILGAGAAGLFCAGSLAGRGLRVAVLEHGRAAGEKIRISGGGRCNFTNLATAPDRFLSQTPRFCASALAGFTPDDFVALVDRGRIAWHEKTQGQLFCDDSAKQIIAMLIKRAAGAEIRLGTKVISVEPGTPMVVQTDQGRMTAGRVVVSTGGKSIPKMGATGVGYAIAEATGHRLVETRPGLVPLTFAEQELARTAPLAGVALDVTARTAAKARKGQRPPVFQDRLLFTHRGLSGPAILQISSFWQPGEGIALNLAPQEDMAAMLRQAKREGGRVQVGTVLGRVLPGRCAAALTDELGLSEARLAEQPDKTLDQIAARVNNWVINPVGSEGYRTAEVTVGGVDCRDLDARTLESQRVPGLYFIGEVVDVTGWLGGYNFQWSWASAHAAAKAIAAG